MRYGIFVLSLVCLKFSGADFLKDFDDLPSIDGEDENNVSKSFSKMSSIGDATSKSFSDVSGSTHGRHTKIATDDKLDRDDSLKTPGLTKEILTSNFFKGDIMIKNSKKDFGVGGLEKIAAENTKDFDNFKKDLQGQKPTPPIQTQTTPHQPQPQHLLPHPSKPLLLPLPHQHHHHTKKV